MNGDELRYIYDAFEENWIATLGENIHRFEEDIRDYTGIKASVDLSSGTPAIHLALIEADVKKMTLFFVLL